MEAITQDLIEALARAHPSDVEFAEEPIRSHSDRTERKVGFRPIRVFGVDVPKIRSAAYVRAEDARGPYWYVVSWNRSSDGRPRTFFVASDAEARAAVLDELRASALGR
jgi:hypothetical protein